MADNWSVRQIKTDSLVSEVTEGSNKDKIKSDLIEGEIIEVLDRSKQTDWLVRSLKIPTKVTLIWLDWRGDNWSVRQVKTDWLVSEVTEGSNKGQIKSDLIEGEITELLDRSKQTDWLVRSLKDQTKVKLNLTWLCAAGIK